MVNADSSQQKAVLIIDQLFQQAIEYHQAGQLQNAERLYRVVLKIQHDHSDAQYNLKLIEEQVKEIIENLPKYKAALEAEPTQGEHWQVYAEALLIAGQAMEALLVIKTAQECGLEDTTIKLLQQRAVDALQDDRASNTSKITEPIIQTQASLDGIDLVKQQKTEITSAKKKAAKEPKSISRFNSKKKALSQNEIEQLITLFNAGQYIELEKSAYSLLNKNADEGFIWKTFGAAQQMQGKDALQALQKATEFMPDDSEAHNNLGAYLVKIGQFQAAETSCRRAIQINTNSAAAHYNLGIALLKNDQLDNALESFRNAIEIKEDYSEAYNSIGNVLAELGQIDEALASYRHALEINPNYTEVHNNLGGAYLKLKLYNEAISCYRQSLTIKPDNAEMHFNLGSILTEIGQYDQSVACFQQALKLKSDYKNAYKNMGVAFLRNGKLNDAEISFRHALKINPKDAKTNSNLLFVLNYHLISVQKLSIKPIRNMILRIFFRYVQLGKYIKMTVI